MLMYLYDRIAVLRGEHSRNLFISDDDVVDGILFAFEVIEIEVHVTREEDLCSHKPVSPRRHTSRCNCR